MIHILAIIFEVVWFFWRAHVDKRPFRVWHPILLALACGGIWIAGAWLSWIIVVVVPLDMLCNWPRVTFVPRDKP